MYRHRISERVSEHKSNPSGSLLVSLGNLITRTFCGHTDRLKRACACMNKTKTPQKGDYIRLCFFCESSPAHLHKRHTVMESVRVKKKFKVQRFFASENDECSCVAVSRWHTNGSGVGMTSVPFQFTDGKLLTQTFETGQLISQSGERAHYNIIKSLMFKRCRSVDLFYFRCA